MSIVTKRKNVAPKSDNFLVEYRGNSDKTIMYQVSTDFVSFYKAYSPEINDLDWHYFNGGYNGTHIISCIDTICGSPTAFSDTITDNSYPTLIGTRDGFSYYLNGSIDDVMIFNRSLTSAEILRIYNHTFKGNTTAEQQQVYNVEIDDCSNFTFPILNFSYLDSITLDKINASNFYDLLFLGHIDQTLQGSFSGNSSNAFCGSNNFTQLGVSYNTTGQITLSKDLYGTQIYEYTSINKLVGDIFNYNLYLAPLANTSTVVFTWRTNTFENVDGIQEIYTCDGTGNRTLVGTASIINGEAYANIELLNTPYSYEVIYQGVRYADTDTYSKCHIETQTTRLYILDVGTPTAPITGLYSINCNITRTGNYSSLMTWGTNPESSNTITGCIFAYRQTVRGATEIYSECSNTSGIAVTVADSGYTYIINGKLYQNGYSIDCQNTQTYETASERADAFGITGVLAIFFLIAGMILLFSNEKPKFYPILGIMGMIIAWILGILSFGWVGISSLAFFVIIIVFIGRRGKTQ